jgi:16S rRNA G966 N2-methylase RsmD
MSDYADIVPIQFPIAADRQSAKRHYGVHPYFTRRPHNVVRQYILHYSREHDCVLDPFGGSGVTAIEAYLENRRGIQNDINPLANFIAGGIAHLACGSITADKDGLAALSRVCQEPLADVARSNETQLLDILNHVPLPENIQLPSNSDVARYCDLFTPGQLASLAIIKNEINKIADADVKSDLLLAWSATLSKLNKTFISTEGRAESRGGSSIFSIYRYKVAKEPVQLPAWKTFMERAENVLVAKAEIHRAIELKSRTRGWSGAFQLYSQDVEGLSQQLDNTVDYIFTDPPYGGHISYLDLSTLWNNWLGILPPLTIREQEIIVGGELKLTEESYTERLSKSIRACVRMLKHGRWLSVVFQHWSLNYFEAILTAATEEGAELKAAVSQIGDPIWSMHKKKNRETVLAGEFILTFYKSGRRKERSHTGEFSIHDALYEILSEETGPIMYSEAVFNKLIIAAWDHSALHSLNIGKAEFISLIESHGWSYDINNHRWTKTRGSETSLFTYTESA